MIPHIQAYNEFIEQIYKTTIPFDKYDGYILSGWCPYTKRFIKMEMEDIKWGHGMVYNTDYYENSDFTEYADGSLFGWPRRTLYIDGTIQYVRELLFKFKRDKDYSFYDLYKDCSKYFYVMTNDVGLIHPVSLEYINTFWFNYSPINLSTNPEWYKLFLSMDKRLFINNEIILKEEYQQFALQMSKYFYTDEMHKKDVNYQCLKVGAYKSPS